MKQFESERCLKLRRMMENLDTLPPSPPVAREIATLRKDVNGTIHRLSSLISIDPCMCAMVIRDALDTYKEFNTDNEILSSKDAIYKVLGFEPTMTIVLAAIKEHNNSLPLTGPVGLQYVWKHSVYLALCAYYMGEILRTKGRDLNRSILYTSGILHDIGYYVLAHLFPSEFSVLNQRQDSDNPSNLYADEIELFGYSHAEIGSTLLATWGFPEAVTQTVRCHHCHCFCDGPYRDYSMVLGILEHHLSMCFGYRSQYNIEYIERYMAELDLTDKEVRDCITTILDSHESIEHLFESINLD